MRGYVVDGQYLGGLQDLLNLWVLRQAQLEVRHAVIVAGGDHVAHARFVVRRQHDRYAIDLYDLGDAAHHREQDVVEVHRRSQSPGELTGQLSITLLARELLAHAVGPQQLAQAWTELKLRAAGAHELL